MRIKAFTILEVLISLILISIIIGLIFTLLTIVGKQISLFSSQGNEELTYNLFNTTIKRDINNTHDFSILDNQIVLKNYDESIINYTLSKEYVLRTNLISTDTFKLKVITYSIQEIQSQDLHNKKIVISFELLNDTIKTNYFLYRDQSHIINKNFYYED